MVLTLGCGGSSPTAPTSGTGTTFTGLTVMIESGLEVGGSARAMARANFSNGTTRDVTSQAEWSSLTPERVRADPEGMLRGLMGGAATIQATYQGQRATADAVVRGRRFELTVKALALDVLSACENLFEGDGEFSYRITAKGTDGDDKRVIERVIAETSFYPDVNHIVSIGGGRSHTINQSFTFAMREEPGTYLEFGFRITEWDGTIGSPRPDSRLNDDGLTITAPWQEAGGFGSVLGDNKSITLSTSGCEVRLRYSISFKSLQPIVPGGQLSALRPRHSLLAVRTSSDGGGGGTAAAIASTG